jgi:aspartate/methionine/tyrosine aminotransferase
MWGRTITANSFSKSWNISGWRLGYVYGAPKLIAPLNGPNNIFYVCSPTPLQLALAEVLMSDPNYYDALREKFAGKRRLAVDILGEAGFRIYDSGSAFYIWARIPEGYGDAVDFNEKLISTKGVAGVPGGAFADSDAYDNYMRLCIAREDDILRGALERIRSAID